MKIEHRTHNTQNTASRGQSLFEVVFAVGVMAIILVGVVSLATKSISNSSMSESNAVATKYVQEGVEWIRGQRDAQWINLTGHIGTYCLPSNPLSSWGGTTIPCPGIVGDRSFLRRAILTTVNSTTIDAAVEVSWTDSSGTHTVRSVTRFTNWKK